MQMYQILDMRKSEIRGILTRVRKIQKIKCWEKILRGILTRIIDTVVGKHHCKK